VACAALSGPCRAWADSLTTSGEAANDHEEYLVRNDARAAKTSMPSVPNGCLARSLAAFVIFDSLSSTGSRRCSRWQFSAVPRREQHPRRPKGR
jgi:hypothetical protein